MNFLKTDDKKTKKVVKLSELLENYPECCHLKDPSMTIDLENLHKLTLEYFKNINDQIEKKQNNQSGGSLKLIRPSPHSIDVASFSNVKNLYLNVCNYMKLHRIPQLTGKTLIPYGIVLSTLNLPDDLIILSHLYHDLISYLIKNQLIDKLNFETLIPMRLFSICFPRSSSPLKDMTK